MREAAKGQKEWQRQTKLVGMRLWNNLSMFLQRVLDNNEPGYFYLHEDQSLGIHLSCCAVLRLAVSVRAEHYDMLLNAKIAQLKDTFQAKLGWLIGNMYNRVGTTEWDLHYPDNPVRKVAKQVLEATLVGVADEQIKEGEAELRLNGQLETSTPDEIFEHINSKTVLPRKKKFENRVVEISNTLRLIGPIGGRVINALRKNGALQQTVRQTLTDGGLTENVVDGVANQLSEAVEKLIGEIMTDASFPDRDDILGKFIRGLLQDSQITSLLQ